MSEKLSYEKLSKIATNQTVTVRQQNEIIANQHKELDIKRRQIQMDMVAFEQAKYADLNHQVKQCIDFALQSLPFWKRSTSNVVNRATEYLFAIKKEVAKHVAMDMIAQKAVEESLVETEKVLDEVINETTEQ